MNPSFTTTDALKQFLGNAALNTRDMYHIAEIEEMAEPMIADIGLDIAVRAKFEQYLLVEDGYTIDAQEAFKELGIMDPNSKSDKTKLRLERAGVIRETLKLNDMPIIDISILPAGRIEDNTNKDTSDDDANKDTSYSGSCHYMKDTSEDDTSMPPTGGIENKYGPIYKNNLCIIVKQKGKGVKQTYKYMITKMAFQKVLYRAYKNDKFADYFALMLELHVICKNYESAYVKRQLEHVVSEKDDMISKMRDEMKSYHKESMEVLHETKQAAIESKNETIKTQHKMDAVVDAVEVVYDTFTEAAYHSTAIVKDKEQTYFALTGIIDATTGEIRFKTYRTQKKRMFRVLKEAMTKLKHQLIIPPMYVAGPINIPIAAMAGLSEKLGNIAKGKKMSKLVFISSTNLKLTCINPVWVPNPYITSSEMVGAYVDVITNNQSRAFKFINMPDTLNDIIDEHRKQYNNTMQKATGEVKKSMQAIATAIQTIQASKP